MARIDGHFLAPLRRYRGVPLPYEGSTIKATKSEKRWRVWFYIAIHHAGLEHAQLREWRRMWHKWGAR